MTDVAATADLYDEHEEALQCCDTQFRQYGGRRHFQGRIVTVLSHEDNAILKTVVTEPGEGKVAVVDGGGSLHCAMLGDKMAERARANGWEGIVINGAVRDAAILETLDIAVLALGSNPRKSAKTGSGRRNVPVSFGGATFTPGATLVGDPDGVVVLPPS